MNRPIGMWKNPQFKHRVITLGAIRRDEPSDIYKCLENLLYGKSMHMEYITHKSNYYMVKCCMVRYVRTIKRLMKWSWYRIQFDKLSIG